MHLLTYIAQRVVTLIPTLLGLIILTFFLARVVPADPAAIIAGGTNRVIVSMTLLAGSASFFRSMNLSLSSKLKRQYRSQQRAASLIGAISRQRF